MNAREQANQIFNAAVQAVHPSRLIPQHLFIKDGMLHISDLQITLDQLPGIYVIGAGKASAAMAQVVEEIIGDYISDGLVVTKYDHALPLRKIKCIEAAHPLPDEQSINASM